MYLPKGVFFSKHIIAKASWLSAKTRLLVIILLFYTPFNIALRYIFYDI
jgi:hypothetical protein